MKAIPDNLAERADESGRSGTMRFGAWLPKTAYLLSAVAFSLLGKYSSLAGLAATAIPRLAVFGWLLFYAPRGSVKKRSIPAALIAAVFTLVIAYQIANNVISDGGALFTRGGRATVVLAAIFSLYALYCAVYSAVSAFGRENRCAAKAFFADTTRAEWILCAAAFLLLGGIWLLVAARTNLFYGATVGGRNVYYDAVYTSDTGSIMLGNAYLDLFHYENDLRQPLFALAAMPISIPVWMLSKLLFFAPNALAALTALTQIAILLLTALLVARLTGAPKTERVFFLLPLLCGYAALLFAFNLEQYVVSVFWLVWFLYCAVVSGAGGCGSYILMTGSLLTSGVWFPLIAAGNWKKRAKLIFFTAALFFGVVWLSGAQTRFLQLSSSLDRVLSFAGGGVVPFSTRIMQYFNLLSAQFLAPCAETIYLSNGAPSYQIVNTRLCAAIGAVVLLGAVGGLVLNRRERFARICGAWALFSFALCVLVGWGAPENGMILYAWYFAWAFSALALMGVKKLLCRHVRAQRCVLCGAAAALLLHNLFGMIELVRFGTVFYPVL